ncbi:MAG: hypothetical protein GF364_20260 [Candidatus Lokiarchaeota archaeon]|nr:hypothetical protein [Candidatus Lokiarchaeota archaeon]
MLDIPYNMTISYFDNQIGPNVLFSKLDGEYNIDIHEVPELTRLMDLHDAGDFFLHYYAGIVTANYIFKIRDPYTRGGEHLLMTSMIFEQNETNITEIFLKIRLIEQRLKYVSQNAVKHRLIKQLLNKSASYQQYDKEKMLKTIRNDLISSLTRR